MPENSSFGSVADILVNIESRACMSWQSENSQERRQETVPIMIEEDQ